MRRLPEGRAPASRRWPGSNSEITFENHYSGLVAAVILAVFTSAVSMAETRWVRPGLSTNAPVWGIEGGLKFALHPGGFGGREGGPRGLIRLGYPTLTNGGYDLINFIAIEPIVHHRKGFSELEKSAFDGKPGKMFWTGDSAQPELPETKWDTGTVREIAPGVEQLQVLVRVERFENGAHVRLKLAQRSDAPNELRLTVEAGEDSAEVESCILTATMGNKSRARLLLLNDGPVSSLQLYPDYRDIHFAEHRVFPLERLPRDVNGDVLVSIRNDEENPSTVQPFGRPQFWDYRGAKVTQYWRKPAAEVTGQLACAVNARYTYWGGRQPIPGGVSFENFELREPFRSGQTFIFGIRKGR